MAVVVERVLDLSEFSQSDRADQLVDFLVFTEYKNNSARSEIEVWIEKDRKKHVSFSGSVVRGISHLDPDLTSICGSKMTTEQLKSFITKTLVETDQKIFKVEDIYDQQLLGLLKNVPTTRIDWTKTVSEVAASGVVDIKIRDTDHEFRSDSRDILSIGNINYDCPIDALGNNPDNDRVVACEEHLKKLWQLIQK
jgi:hypothetical protein